VLTLDHLRAAMPDLGFALYAYDPEGPVTLEVHATDGVFTVTAETEAAVVALVLPTEPAPVNIFD
jgi:hypothetical protein